MAKKTSSSKSRIAKARRVAKEQAGQSEGSRPITFSTRFTPAQLKEVENACKVRSWSISQLMLVATLEKAVAINELAGDSSRRTILYAMESIVQGFHGRIPEILVHSQRLGNPEEQGIGDPDRWGRWVRDFDAEFDDSCSIEINKEEGKGPLDSPAGPADSCVKRVRYHFDSRRIDLNPVSEVDTDEVPIASISPTSLPGNVVEQIIACIKVFSPDMAQLVKQAYIDQSLKDPMGRYAYVRTADDLLDPRKQERSRTEDAC